MKLAHFCAALALACVAIFGVAAALTAPADASQFSIERDQVHVGADSVVRLEDPSAEPARAFESTARYTAAAGVVDRDTGSQVDFTEIVAGILLALTALVGWLVRKAFSFLPSYLQGMLLAWRVDQLVETGFNNWAEKKAGEIRARGVTADLRSDALASIVRYGRNKANTFIQKEVGGEGVLEDMAISRLDPLIDKLLDRWVRQKANIETIATPVHVAPAPTERAAANAAGAAEA